MDRIELGSLQEGQNIIVQTGDESILVGAVKSVNRESRSANLDVWAVSGAAKAPGEDDGSRRLAFDDISVAWTGTSDECKDFRTQMEHGHEAAALLKWLDHHEGAPGGDTVGSRKSE